MTCYRAGKKTGQAASGGAEGDVKITVSLPDSLAGVACGFPESTCWRWRLGKRHKSGKGRGGGCEGGCSGLSSSELGMRLERGIGSEGVEGETEICSKPT